VRALTFSLWLGLLAAAAGAEGITVVIEKPYVPAPPDAIYVARAVFAGGRLWALSDRGALSSLASGDHKRRTELDGQRVLDICRVRERVLALSCADQKCGGWKLLEADAGAWQLRTTLDSRKEAFVALHCDAQEALVLSERRAIRTDGQKDLRFSEKLKGGNAVAAVTPNYLFVGFDNGEWGGGMVRVERATGRVKLLE